jgi:hypothetical protein
MGKDEKTLRRSVYTDTERDRDIQYKKQYKINKNK